MSTAVGGNRSESRADAGSSRSVPLREPLGITRRHRVGQEQLSPVPAPAFLTSVSPRRGGEAQQGTPLGSGKQEGNSFQPDVAVGFVPTDHPGPS